jgi:GNAT superfamily N-acetyltransferase
MPDHELIPPSDDEMWAAYHDIRRRVLFEARGRFGVYDENHPDERDPAFHPQVLLWQGTPVGVMRIDLAGRVATFRRVAIRDDSQRQGHGRVMLQLAEEFVRARGCREVHSHVASDAVEFYRKQGFEHTHNDISEALQGSDSILMKKILQ